MLDPIHIDVARIIVVVFGTLGVLWLLYMFLYYALLKRVK
jgi:hypothetical protein